jgi:hypothetical protein
MHRSRGQTGLLGCVIFAAGVLAGAVLSWGRSPSFAVAPAAENQDKPKETPWLTGTADEKFARIEKHLRGLDVAMAEIGYRYGELLIAAGERNWEYTQYQAEKIDLALRLAIERRPKREKSARPFLNEDLPRVLDAVKKKDSASLDKAMARFHDGCVECHKSEKVLHFKSAADRIRDQARSAKSGRDRER